MLNLTRYTESNNNINKFIVWFMNENAHGDGQRLLHSALEAIGIEELLSSEAQIDKLVEDAYFVTKAKIVSIGEAPSAIEFTTTFYKHAGYPGGEYDKNMGTCKLKFDKLTFVLLMIEYMSLLNSGKYKAKEYGDDE